MEDELEDRVLYQTYVSYMKLFSKATGAPLSTNFGAPFNYGLHVFRHYCLKPEVLAIAGVLLIVVMYLQLVDVWSRTLLGRLQVTILSRASMTKAKKLQFFSGSNIDGVKQSWELDNGHIAAYAIQGHRPRMEDRFVVVENVRNTGVSLFAVFDGHGGEFAANYAQEKLIDNLRNKIFEISNNKSNTTTKKTWDRGDIKENKPVERTDSKGTIDLTKKESTKLINIGKSVSTTDSIKKTTSVTDPELLKKIENLKPIVTREVRPSNNNNTLQHYPAKSYIESDGNVNYGKLLTDEILNADKLLVEAAKKKLDVAGTTALVALLHGSKLTVANVGDSRGIMCDSKGNAIPLSFDHKPQQVRERKRIKEAGGFVTFNGVWRVAGILATSRALGDYPLKEKKLVIADPDILTFDLGDHKPSFLIFASDGLWDTFSNEEAIAFIKERLTEPHYGAKSITLQSYYRGSLDNITVLVIYFNESAFSSDKNNKTANV